MKRDMNLIRKLMIEVREKGEIGLGFQSSKVPEVQDESGNDYDRETILDHMMMLVECGLAEGTVKLTGPTTYGTINRLTFAGHDFIEAASNETIWNKAMQKVRDAGSSVSISTLSAVMQQLAKSALGLD